jgi:hypothetical protein
MNTITRFILLLALAAATTPALAGNLTPPGAPGAGSGMPTTKAIFQQLSSGTVPATPGAFQGPSAGPTGGTGRSLSEIKAKLPVADNTNGLKANEAPSGKTFWGLRTDGTWGAQIGTNHMAASVCQPGWAGTYCDVPRWVNNGNGTVTDNRNGLVWLKNANCFVGQDWNSAMSSANSLASGSCSLSDGSTAGQWRLPTKDELASVGPPWPPSTPFSAVLGNYWSGSSNCTNDAWYVSMGYGGVDSGSKSYNFYVWPVRSGQ